MILILIELSALVAMQLNPDVRRDAEWAGLGEFLIMFFAPVALVPLGLLLALLGVLVHKTKKTAAGVGFLFHAVAGWCWLMWWFSK